MEGNIEIIISCLLLLISFILVFYIQLEWLLCNFMVILISIEPLSNRKKDFSNFAHSIKPWTIFIDVSSGLDIDIYLFGTPYPLQW